MRLIDGDNVAEKLETIKKSHTKYATTYKLFECGYIEGLVTATKVLKSEPDAKVAEETAADQIADQIKDALAAERIADALAAVVWYNRLYELIAEWIKWGDHATNDYCIACPPGYMAASAEWGSEDKGQAQLLWMVAVCLYGEYGTSPRYGWILKDNWEECKQFFKRLCTYWVESEEYNGEID